MPSAERWSRRQNAGNIADTVSVRILKAALVDLIHDKILHPIFFCSATTLPPVQYLYIAQSDLSAKYFYHYNTVYKNLKSI